MHAEEEARSSGAGDGEPVRSADAPANEGASTEAGEPTVVSAMAEPSSESSAIESASSGPTAPDEIAPETANPFSDGAQASGADSGVDAPVHEGAPAAAGPGADGPSVVSAAGQGAERGERAEATEALAEPATAATNAGEAPGQGLTRSSEGALDHHGPQAAPASADAAGGSISDAAARAEPGEAAPAGAGRAVLLVVASLAITALIVGAALIALPRKVDLIVDNGHVLRLVVRIDGVVRGEVQHRGKLKISGVRAGEVTLAAEDPKGRAQAVGFVRSATLTGGGPFGARPTYVWNVGGATRAYWVLSKGYGDRRDESFAPEPLQVEGDVFPLPDDLLPRLDELFPEQVVAGRGPDGKPLTGAVRRAPFTDRFVMDKLLERRIREQVEERAAAAGFDLQELIERSRPAEPGPEPTGTEPFADEPPPFPPVAPRDRRDPPG